ncbi:hypothetical protein ACS6Z0_02545 [Streptococcus suis]
MSLSTCLTLSYVCVSVPSLKVISCDWFCPVGQKLANRLAGKMAKTLYATILRAGKHALEDQ